MTYEGIQYRTAHNWKEYIPVIPGDIYYLEIGLLHGANILSVGDIYATSGGSILYGIDPWEDYDSYDEYKNTQETSYRTFRRNVERSKHASKIRTFRGYSHNVIPTFKNNFFDIIYIDGNHLPHYVLEDAVLSFRKLKVGGYMIFDDYGWGGEEMVKSGIDGFLKGYHKCIELLGERETQIFVRKTHNL